MGVMVSNDRLWWSKFIFPEFDAVLNLAQRVSLKYQANFKEAFDIFYNEELIKFSDLNVWYIQEYGWIIEPWPEEVEVKKKKSNERTMREWGRKTLWSPRLLVHPFRKHESNICQVSSFEWCRFHKKYIGNFFSKRIQRFYETRLILTFLSAVNILDFCNFLVSN